MRESLNKVLKKASSPYTLHPAWWWCRLAGEDKPPGDTLHHRRFLGQNRVIDATHAPPKMGIEKPALATNSEDRKE